MSYTSIISYRLRAPVRGVAMATKKVFGGLAPKPYVPASIRTHLHPEFATAEGLYGPNLLLVAEDGTMFHVAKAILAVEAPEFQSIATSLPPWDICRLVGTGNVRYIPGVESNALALVLSMVVNPDEDDDWVNEAVIAGNKAIDLFLDCIHAALKYRLPFIDRLYTAINAHKDVFLVCPFLRCFLACAMRDDNMVRQYAWRTLPLKRSDMHLQLETMWKEHMPHAYYEYTLFHKQFHGPAIKVIKALRSSVLPGRHNGHFDKLCRRPEHEVSIDEHPCKTIVEYKRDWRRARDVAAHHVTTHLFADWVNWELLVWTYAYIASIIFDSSETQWCGRCFKALGRIFYDIIVKRHGMDLALVEEACADRPLFHVLRTTPIRWNDEQANMNL